MTRAMLQIHTQDAERTGKLGAAIAAQCTTGDCIALRGDLGSGKTTLARGFIRGLGAQDEEIVSPTFTLVQTYTAKGGRAITHFDLYRLRAAEETQELGLDEALDTGITLIEWPELVQHCLPVSSLDVHIACDGAAASRTITLQGDSAIWKNRFEKMENYVRGS